MRVTFSATGSLRRYLPGRGDSAALDLPPGATVAGLLQRLDITWGEVGIIAINSRLAGEESALHEGERVELIAPLAGG